MQSSESAPGLLQGQLITERVKFGAFSSSKEKHALSCPGIIDTDISGGLEATIVEGCQVCSCCSATPPPWHSPAAECPLGEHADEVARGSIAKRACASPLISHAFLMSLPACNLWCMTLLVAHHWLLCWLLQIPACNEIDNIPPPCSSLARMPTQEQCRGVAAHDPP